GGAFGVLVAGQPQFRLTQWTNRRLKPAAAITSRTRASSPRTSASSQQPPSRSCTSAGSTSKAHTKPSESTATKRLRPLTFFPPVVALGAADVGRLDRLAVHPQRRRGRHGARLEPHFLAQRGVGLLPHARQPPQAAAGGA